MNIKFICLICGKLFERPQCHQKRNPKYCSIKCFHVTPWNKAKTYTQEEKDRLFPIAGWNKGKSLTEEHKKNIGLANKGKRAGKKYEEIYGIEKATEIKRKLSKYFFTNNPGKNKSKAWRQGHSEFMRGRYVGAKSSLWKGGLATSYQYQLSLPEWQKLRKEIYERDNWICQICFKHCATKEIQCHHIEPYKISRNNSKENLITLCSKCHCIVGINIRKIGLSPIEALAQGRAA